MSQPNSPALFSQEIAERLVDRLDFIRIEPKKILEMRAGLGYGTELLKKRYPYAEIFLAESYQPLPVADRSIELLVSNLFLPQCENLPVLFAEMYRVLKPGGLLLFSTLGPDTLQELRASWAAVDDLPHVQIFFDMHDVGDGLLQAHFADPVMDMELLTVRFRNVETIFRELKNMHATNKLIERRKTLTGKKRFADFLEAMKKYRDVEEKFLVSAEVIYGHAWRPLTEPGEVRIGIESIRGISRSV